jgi:2-polyprenyl-6-methoxyphenol hydroxylase-like FAD-dependent oxidoreductase
MAQAYVLASELRDAAGDHARAFARYEARLMPFLRRKQATAAKFASSFAPKTRAGIAFRDLVTRLMRFSWITDRVLGGDLRDDIELPDDRLR